MKRWKNVTDFLKKWLVVLGIGQSRKHKFHRDPRHYQYVKKYKENTYFITSCTRNKWTQNSSYFDVISDWNRTVYWRKFAFFFCYCRIYNYEMEGKLWWATWWSQGEIEIWYRAGDSSIQCGFSYLPSPLFISNYRTNIINFQLFTVHHATVWRFKIQ
jgi:hypothetical protein